MLKELFSNRLFIGALAFFVLCVVGGTLYISHVEKQGAEELATDEDPVKQVTEKQQPQPTAEAPVGEETPQGHFHEDGTFHAEPHDAPAQPTQSASTESIGELVPRPGSFLEKYLSQFSPAEAKRAMSAWYGQAGVPPPPRGYEYIWDDAWVVKRDAAGNPVINKIGEPYIQVHTITAFAPNPEQARRYLKLKNDALRTTDPNEEARLRAEMYRIVDEAQGPYPLVTAYSSVKAAKSKASQRMREAEDKALVDFGLGHLVGTGIGGQVIRPLPFEE